MGRPFIVGGITCYVCKIEGPLAPSRDVARKRASEAGWARNGDLGWRCKTCRHKGLVLDLKKEKGLFRVVCSECAVVGPEGQTVVATTNAAKSLGWSMPRWKFYRCPECKEKHSNGWARGSSLHIDCSPELYQALENERKKLGVRTVSHAMRAILSKHFGIPHA